MYPGPKRPSNEVAQIRGGEATIHKIDGIQVRGSGWFEVLPGSHTMQVSDYAVRPGLLVTTTYNSGMVSLCVKAMPGGSYEIESSLVGERMRMRVVDSYTGRPPKTPCGPDEDDD
jgi:hypothetical protein